MYFSADFIKRSISQIKSYKILEKTLTLKSLKEICSHITNSDTKIRKIACKILCVLGKNSYKFYHMISKITGEAYNNQVNFII